MVIFVKSRKKNTMVYLETIRIHLCAFVDVAAILSVVGQSVTVGTFARKRSNRITTAAVAANSKQKATLIHI